MLDMTAVTAVLVVFVTGYMFGYSAGKVRGKLEVLECDLNIEEVGPDE